MSVHLVIETNVAQTDKINIKRNLLRGSFNPIL